MAQELVCEKRNHLDCKQPSSHASINQTLGSTTDPIRKTALLNHDREKKLRHFLTYVLKIAISHRNNIYSSCRGTFTARVKVEKWKERRGGHAAGLGFTSMAALCSRRREPSAVSPAAGSRSEATVSGVLALWLGRGQRDVWRN